MTARKHRLDITVLDVYEDPNEITLVTTDGNKIWKKLKKYEANYGGN